MTDEERRELARRAVGGDHEALLCLIERSSTARLEALEQEVKALKAELLERERIEEVIKKAKEFVTSGFHPVTVAELIVDSKTTRMASTPPPDRRDVPEYHVGGSSG